MKKIILTILILGITFISAHAEDATISIKGEVTSADYSLMPVDGPGIITFKGADNKIYTFTIPSGEVEAYYQCLMEMPADVHGLKKGDIILVKGRLKKGIKNAIDICSSIPPKVKLLQKGNK